MVINNHVHYDLKVINAYKCYYGGISVVNNLNMNVTSGTMYVYFLFLCFSNYLAPWLPNLLPFTALYHKPASSPLKFLQLISWRCPIFFTVFPLFSFFS